MASRIKTSRHPQAAEREGAQAPGPAAVPWHDSPRQAAQRAAITAAFGSASAVVQCLPAGRYITTADGNLRGVDKKSITKVQQGTEARVYPGALTSTFKLGTFSISKDHTWAHVQGQQGWLKDSVLGTAVPELPVPRVVRDLEPIRREPLRPTPSRAIGVGGKAASKGEPQVTTTLEALEEYRRQEDPTLDEPGIAKGAKPLGLGRPFDKVDPADYRIVVKGGLLYEREGQGLLTVEKSPFVLTLEGRLYGGQGDNGDVFAGHMAAHGQAEVGSPAWAGELAAEDGRVTYINNQSGTYKLSDRANINLIKFLYRQRVLTAEQIPELKIDRVYKPGFDRDGELEPHNVLG